MPPLEDEFLLKENLTWTWGGDVDNKHGLGASKGRHDAMSPMLPLQHGLGFHLEDPITQGGERGRYRRIQGLALHI